MRLRWLDQTSRPVIVRDLEPLKLLGLSVGDVLRQQVWIGNETADLGELFEVSDKDEGTLTLEGDLRHVQGIGKDMAGGTLVVRGDAGAFLGTGMSSGAIHVHGSVTDYAGAEIRGGFLEIHGSAGYGLGAAYSGSRIGMREGVILVRGSVGEDAGFKMRRGLIAVGGDAGDGLGRSLIAGSLFVFGRVGRFPGLGMKRGSIGILGQREPDLPLCFEETGSYRFPFLSIYLRKMAAWGLPVPFEMFDAEFARYNGDLSEGGIGEILVADVPQ